MILLAILINAGIFLYQWNVTYKNGQAGLRNCLNDYARMKPDYSEKKNSPCLSLSESEHEVLLGVLKKVESKNSSLTTVWAFIAAALVTMAFSSMDDEFKPIVGIGIFLLIPYFLASIVGMRQLDQVEYNRFVRQTSQQDAVKVKLQDSLLSDVMLKELVFRYSRAGAMLFVPMSLFLISFYLVYTPIWLGCSQ